MRTIISIAAAGAIAASLFAAPAFAQAVSARAEQSVAQIATSLTERGYQVIEVERDDGHYEVKAIASNGQCVELDVDRRSGDVIRTKRDDDCRVASRPHGQGR